MYISLVKSKKAKLFAVDSMSRMPTVCCACLECVAHRCMYRYTVHLCLYI